MQHITANSGHQPVDRLFVELWKTFVQVLLFLVALGSLWLQLGCVPVGYVLSLFVGLPLSVPAALIVFVDVRPAYRSRAERSRHVVALLRAALGIAGMCVVVVQLLRF